MSKNIRMFEAITELPDALVQEAVQTGLKRPRRKWYIAGAAALLALALALSSLLPGGSALSAYALYTPEIPSDAAVPVRLGTEDWAAAVPGETAQLLVEKGQLSSVTTELTLESDMAAPVSQGQRLGTLTVRCGEQILTQIPMVAEAPIPRLTWQQMTGEILRRIAMSGT